MVRFRPGTLADSRLAFDLFVPTIEDLGRRTGGSANSTPGTIDDAWAIRQPLFEHLGATADAWWFAEDEITGQALGYARSILRDGVRELTEFFVLPEAQGTGIGRDLLARVFPAAGARHRAVVATIDPRAIARYTQSGLDGKVPIAAVEGAPRDIMLATDLVREPIDPGAPPVDELGVIDRSVLDFRRDLDHRWLAAQRPGWLYRRAGRAVAYAYHHHRPAGGGPFAALDPADLPTLLADAERSALAAGHPTITFDMALTARTAWDHLLGGGYRVDPFVMLFFTDGPVRGLDRYVLTSPPFFA